MCRARRHDEDTDLVEVFSNNLPDARPLETDTSHVVVWNLDNFLQTEHARMRRMWQLLHWYDTQRPNKLHCQSTDITNSKMQAVETFQFDQPNSQLTFSFQKAILKLEIMYSILQKSCIVMNHNYNHDRCCYDDDFWPTNTPSDFP